MFINEDKCYKITYNEKNERDIDVGDIMGKLFDKKNNISSVLLVGFVLILFLLSGCNSKVEKNLLNPDEPVSVSLWHYYSGHNKEKFDELVSKFNNSIGMEKGIVIDAKSLGDVEELKTVVLDVANKKIGAQPMPDIFAAYPVLISWSDWWIWKNILQKKIFKNINGISYMMDALEKETS